MGPGPLSRPAREKARLMSLGIVAAMAAEARILVKGKVTPGALIHLPEGAMMVLSGIGTRRARSAARTLTEKGATGLVSWGVAGALLSAFSPGALILSETIIAADGSVYHADPTWHERLCGKLKGHVALDKGSLAESAAVLSRAEKETLYRRTGAVAVDMESASIALVAEEARIPFVAIRSITDTVEMDIPRILLSSTDEFGRVQLSRLLFGILRRPPELLALVRLGLAFRAAKATLAAVALHAGENFAYGTATK